MSLEPVVAKGAGDLRVDRSAVFSRSRFGVDEGCETTGRLTAGELVASLLSKGARSGEADEMLAGSTYGTGAPSSTLTE